MEVFSLQKVVEMIEEVVVVWWEVRWIWRMRQNFIAQFVQLLKHWLYDMHLGIVVENNWALSVDQCRLQAVQFSVRLIDLLSILLSCNGFTRSQKAVVDQTDSRSPNSDHDLFFFWCKFGFGKFFGASSRSNHWVGHHWLSYTAGAKSLQLSDSLRPYRPWPTRLFTPWDFPGKRNFPLPRQVGNLPGSGLPCPGVGCYVLLQGIFPTQGSKLHLLYLLHWQPGCHLGSLGCVIKSTFCCWSQSDREMAHCCVE